MDPNALTDAQIATMDPATLQAALQQMRDRAIQENRDAQAVAQQLAAERARPINVQPAPVNAQPQKPKPPKPPMYDGTRNVEAINEWTRHMYQYCVYYSLSLEESLQTSALYLTKDAATWWQYYVAGTRATPPTLPAIRSWDDFVRKIKDAFAPKNHQRAIEDEFHYLSQKTSVKTYAYHFRRLMIQLPSMPRDEQIRRFIRGLKENVKAELLVRAPATLEEAENIAQIYDETHYRKSQPPAPPKPSTFADRGKRSDDAPFRLPDSSQRVYTGPQPMDLGNVQPPDRRLPKLDAAEKKRLMQIGACFKCRLPGHVSSQCPSRRPSNPTVNTHQPSRQPLRINTVDAATATTPSLKDQRQ